MAWYNKNYNITKPNINISDYTRDDLPEHIIDKHRENAGSFWLSWTSITLFLFGLFVFARKNGFMQGVMMSSFCAFILSTTFILNNFSYTIYPFFLFGFIWTISVIAVYNGKEGNKI
ncbi:MAG: hypothetical protein R6V14_04550 [Halanaerobiales bacterium]